MLKNIQLRKQLREEGRWSFVQTHLKEGNVYKGGGLILMLGPAQCLSLRAESLRRSLGPTLSTAWPADSGE